MIEAAESRTKEYLGRIASKREERKTISTTNLKEETLQGYELENTIQGKVRDLYICANFIVMISTDRQSAFDRVLTTIPLKGQVIERISNYWFQETAHLVPNHFMASPHLRVSICRRCQVFPIEFVMRGYITGSTSTSMATNYFENGMREYCGHRLPEGLMKNQKLAANLLTPTTKGIEKDELISSREIVLKALLTQSDFDVCSEYAHTLFSFGQMKAREKGLILVDTKYEFGRDLVTGKILLVDEIHTPG